MSNLPFEFQWDSLEEEETVSQSIDSRDKDRLTAEQDYFIPWLRLINPRIDAVASTREILQFLRLDEQDLEDLEF